MFTSLRNRPHPHTHDRYQAHAQRDTQRGGQRPAGDLKGYQENFLDIPLPLPQVDEQFKDLVAPLKADSSKSELEYTHFSVVMNKVRRTAMFTACNVDGAQYNEQPRDGKWDFDPRMDRKYQLGNEAYSNNDFDKGHMVRRRDPMWGPDAHAGSNDTFAFTNASLQHSGLNQHKWLDLENHVLSLANKYERKVTVFTGPVLKDSDPSFDNNGKMDFPTKIPLAFWKVMVWNEPGEGLKSESFVMSQEDLVSGRAKPPSSDEHVQDFAPYRIPLAKLEEITHLDFGNIIDSPTTQAPVPQPPGGGD